MRWRAAIGGFALALTPGWAVSNVGAVADASARAYGTGLAVIGLFTTGLFVTHAAFQVPAGRLCDRLGARVVGASGLALVSAASAAALLWRDPWFAIALRMVAGFGTAAAFVSGSDYIRTTIGSPFAQGMYGASSMTGGGVALALIPLWGTWQAPFVTAAIIAAAGVVAVAAAPPERARAVRAHERPRLRDRRLVPLAVMHAASFGGSVILGNWIVTLLHRAGGDSEHVAGIVGALILGVGIVSRPLGGRLSHHVALLRVSFLVGGAAVALLAVARPLPLAIAAAFVVGLAAGLPFAPAFAGAARVRPDAPGAAVGLVNMAAAVTILVGTPLVGLSFSLPGDGRIGFVVVAVLWAAAAAAVPRRNSHEPGTATPNLVRPKAEPGS